MLTDVEKRMGAEAIHKRLRREKYKHSPRRKEQHQNRRYTETAHMLMDLALHLFRLRKQARANVLNIRITTHELSFRDLPPAFDGFTILHLSDPHLGMLPELAERIVELIKPLKYDLCVFTGDFFEASYSRFDTALEEVRLICDHIPTRILGIMGNHDFLEAVEPLEAAGIEMLLNEHAVIEQEDQQLYILGVDDPHYYRTDDLNRALTNLTDDAFKILLVHSSELYEQAEAAGINLYLCGHTHGGQFCLLENIPVLTNARSPRHMYQGNWRFKQMAGYTSAGTGVSSIAGRLNCPAEITLHQLRRA